MYDINNGVGPYGNSFDIVHNRAIMAGVKDYRSYLHAVATMLRPGGVFLNAEVDWFVRDEHGNKIQDTWADTETGPVKP